ALALTSSKVDVLCFGNATGSVDLSVSGGTTPYSYVWSNGAATQDITALAAGTYSVTVTDNNNCTATASVTIGQPAAALALTSSKVDVLCFGNATGSIDLTVSGGTTPYTYVWSNGATTQDITALAAGTYSVTVTDNNNCTATASVTIGQPAAALALTSSKVDVLCFGNTTGSVDLTVSGGTTPYTYVWSNGATTQDITALAAGTYSVTVTDNNNCTATASVTIGQPAAALALTSSKVDVLCFGNTTGSVDLTVSGGTTPYTYVWSNGATTQDITALAAGTYSVTVTDNNNCTATASVTIGQPAAALALTSSKVDVLCFGNTTGSVDLTVSGGTTPYTYVWSNGATTQDITALAAGTYSVTVTDNNNCTATASVTIGQPAAALALTSSKVDVLCFGNTTGSVDLTVSGGTTPYTYVWSNGATTQDITALAAGTYSVTVTDNNNCTATASVTIGQPAAALALTSSKVDVLCFGNATGSVDLSVSGGTTPYSYVWSNGAATQDITALAAGTYTVTVTDNNNCTATASVTIGQPAAALALTSSKVDVLCFGNTTGSVDLSVNGGTTPYTYVWSNGAATQDITALAAGTYTVTVTDNNNCTATASVTIVQPAAITINSISSNTPVCSGSDLNLSSNTSGGTGTLNYSWSGPNGFTSTLQNPVITNVTTAANGMYTLVVTDQNGCSGTATTNVTITQRPTASVSYPASAFCINNNIAQPVTLTGTGAYTGGSYTSSPVGLSIHFSNGSIVPSASAPGTYSITYTIPASGGCPAIPVVFNNIITITPVPTANIIYTGSPYCNSVTTAQPVTLTGTNAYTGGTFSALAGLTIDPVTGAITPSTSTPGTYTVTYTSPATGGCAAVTAINSVTITAAPTATISYSGTTFCSNGGVIQVTQTGTAGGTYSGTVGLQINNTTGAINLGTSATGTHTITYTIPAAGGCAAFTTNTTITINPLPAATISYTGGPFCPTNTNIPVTISGTNGGVFSAPAGLSINSATGSINAAASTPGIYTVTYTIAAVNSCPAVIANTSVTIGDNIAPVLTVPANVVIQCGSSQLPAATGQATATDNCTADANITINYTDVITAGNCVGRYTITRTWTATDANGNTATGVQTINVDDTTAPVISCNNFSVANPDAIPAANSNSVTATDNCGAVTITLINEVFYGLEGKPGFCPTSVERTWQAADDCGNVSTCTQTITVQDVSNCSVCQSTVPFFPVILTGNPDSTWISPSVVRDGLCCGATGPPPPRCVSFNLYLDENSIGIIFNIASGAIPPGALYYHIDCGPPHQVGEFVCLQGNRFYTLTFCKPGNNPNTYSIQSVSGVTGVSNLTTRADANCPGQLSVSGIQPNTVTWSVASPNDQSLLRYLSCTDCLNPIFTPDANAPASIVYQVCGTVTGSLNCNGQPVTDCKDVTVNVIPTIQASVNVPPVICSSNIPNLTASISPAGTYVYEWYSQPNGMGTVLSTNSSGFTPPTAGNYSLVVTETQTGLLCNKDTTNYTIAFDLSGPVLDVPAPLYIECNSNNTAATISAWLASATAYDSTNISNLLPVSNNYSPFTQTCGGVRIVTFTAVDSCGNVTTDTSSIRILDTSPPSIICPPTLNVSCPPIPAFDLASFIAAGGSATDICDANPTISFVSDVISNQTCPNNYIVTRTYQATDDCGNSSTCSQTIIVNNTTPPAVPANVTTTVECILAAVPPTVPTVRDGCGAIITPTLVVSGDPDCEGAKTYTYTFTECAGLSSTWVFTYLIDRTTPPTAVPANGGSTVNCPDATDVAPVLPVVTDVCGNILTPSAPVISPKPACEGTRTYTYTYTDCSGLSINWVYTYTVEYLPFANPVDAGSTVSCLAAANTAPTTLPVVTDNCGNILTPSAPIVSPALTCEGTRTYRYIYTDCEGNTQDWVYTYTVENESFADPVDAGSTVSCPAATNTPPAVLPVVIDNCGNVLTPSAPVISTALTCEGTRTYTYTYTDCEGNTQNWVYTYTVEYEPFADPVDAGSTVACPAATNNPPTLPVVTDNCGNVLTPSVPVVSPALTCEGTRTYTYTYTDCKGNTQDWVYTYTVDYQPIPMPANGGSTVSCPANANGSGIALPTVRDACGNILTASAPVITDNPSTLSCSGTRTYTYTYVDCSGATATWSYTYTISAPIVNMPANVASTVACLADAVAPTPPAVTDNCGRAITPSAAVGSADPACAGIKTYTFTYTDCNGVAYNWVYTYTISVPVVVMPANGSSTVACLAEAVTPVPPTVTDNCGRAITPSAPVASADPACAGIKTYTFTYTDCNGVSYNWVYTYTISAPVLVMPANGTLTVACLADAVAPTPPVVTDNCGRTITPSAPVVSPDPACAGTKTYTYTYTACDNQTYQWTYTYTIAAPVVDVSLPANGASTVACPAQAVAPTPPTVTDNCGRTINPSAPVVTPDPVCGGTKTYTYTYYDCDGTAYNWSYTYTILTPTVILPANGASTVACLANAITPTPPAVTDNCGRVIIPSAPVVSADPTCAGIKTYIYTYTDCNGAAYNWIYTYTISAPLVNMPANGASTVACLADAVTPTPPVVTDNCGRAITPSAPVVSADPVCAGIKTYTYTYTDCNGGAYNWIYTYTISAPLVNMPANGASTVACLADAVTPTPPVVTDNCGRAITPSAPVVSADPVCAGIKTYTYTYTDCIGVAYNWIYTYTISAPLVNMPANGASTVACLADAITPTPPVVTDNCGRAITPSAPVGSADPACAGIKIYTFTYTDCNGIAYNWVYTYTISAPAVVMPANGSSTVACLADAVTPTPPVVTDNCGRAITPSAPVVSADPVCAGIKTYTYIYTDCYGTTYNWVYTYTISAPVVNMPANGASTVACLADAVVPTPPSVTDNCGRVITPSAPVVSADPVCAGIKTYTYTYTNCNGVSHNWVYTYTITPTTLTVACPPTQTFCELSGNNYTIPLLAASNNCNDTLDISFQITGATTRSGVGNDASGTFNPGTSTITWRVADACGTSTCTTSITINSAAASEFTAAACLSYILPWGDVVNTSDDYTHTYTTVNGCDSVVTAHITINTAAASEFTAAACLSYTLPWGDVV
ncbi:HYR-like domain-containing protein, partial [Terrimonas alba]|uniref:HYR-like domain-containing protein n=1 Tax=Terrimonas alba TaxID=3349636 RepID=UPI0035F461F7